MVKKLNKLSEPLNTNINLAHEVLNILMDSSSFRARTLAACKALRLGINISKALLSGDISLFKVFVCQREMSHAHV